MDNRHGAVRHLLCDPSEVEPSLECCRVAPLTGEGPVGIPGATAKDKENRWIPFNPDGRLAAILKRRSELGPDAYVFGSANGTYQPSIQTAWETLRPLANGIEAKSGKEGATWNQEHVRRIDLRWHDLRHEGASRLRWRGHPNHSTDARPREHSADAAISQRDGRRTATRLGVSWKNQGRPLRLASGS